MANSKFVGGKKIYKENFLKKNTHSNSFRFIVDKSLVVGDKFGFSLSNPNIVSFRFISLV